jgi:hypothetical protein
MRYRYAKLRGTIAALPESGKGPSRQLQIVEGDIVEDGVFTHLVAGKPVSFTLAVGEVDRMLGRGSFVREGELTGTEQAIETAKTSKASQQAKIVATLELDQLAGYDPAELVTLWAARKPKVTDVLAAVGDSKELAQKALDAENGATKQDPRATLKAGLDKVITAEAAA